MGAIPGFGRNSSIATVSRGDTLAAASTATWHRWPSLQNNLFRLELDGEEVKPAATPGVKPAREQVEADEPLSTDKLSPYRAVVARGN